MALEPAILAWLRQPSGVSYDAIAAGAQSLLALARAFPDNGTGSATYNTIDSVRGLATYPGNDAIVGHTLDYLRLFLPQLPPIIFDGHFTVGLEVEHGTYRTFEGVEGCYWETLDNAGNINDNNFVNAAPQVIATIRQSDFAFNSEDCGPWVQTG